MAAIKARGSVLGIWLNVIVSDDCGTIEVTFNGKHSNNLEEHFWFYMSKRYSMLGTYRPPVDSMLNALNVLQYHFFDQARVDVEIEGDIGTAPQPGGPDAIY